LARVFKHSLQVFLITGGNGGLGQILGAMLYAKDAKVYIAARSEAKAQKTIDEIKALHPASAGELVFLKLDLSDLGWTSFGTMLA
jgi:retinol dehydrogenase-12